MSQFRAFTKSPTKSPTKSAFAAVFAAALALGAPFFGAAPALAAGGQGVQPDDAIEFERVDEGGQFVVHLVDGKAECRDMTKDELQRFLGVDAAKQGLHVINPHDRKTNGDDGMTILLRATSQLEANSAAKQSFIAAAARWEQRIKSPITVVIDVDFGETYFGEDYGNPNIIGITQGQNLLSRNGYTSLRAKLVASASNRQEAAIFGALPATGVPTDLGVATSLYAASPELRALGLLNRVADPVGEGTQLGAPPRIGFNSAFPFDFNPDNGIDSDKIDFDATVTHELGHAIGFISAVGIHDFNPNLPILVSIWDLGRFRPGTTLETFTSAQRVLKPGGTQVYFTNVGLPLGLSTSRGDGTGGDGNQASHWKTRYTNATGYIGIMDPTGDFGDRDQITANDELALDFFGYSLAGGVAPNIDEVAADLSADSLTITGSGTDGDGNVIAVEATYVDGSGATVSEVAPVTVDTGFVNSFDFSATLTGLGALPTAVKASIVLIDGNGNRSAAVQADFSGATAGGPSVVSSSFKSAKGKLKIKGTNFGSTASVEINGVVLSGVTIKAPANGKSLTLTGDLATLKLHTGANRVRVIKDGKHSNIYLLTL